MVNVLAMDGSVLAVGGSIDLPMWRAIGNRSDGRYVNVDD